ncbi:MAG: hypothetical protein AB1705_26050 [Verrucomicrobiota bacterium]
MKASRKSIAVFFSITVMFLLALALTRYLREPSHQDRKVSAWLWDIHAYGVDTPQHQNAVLAFQAMGEDAVPTLVRHLHGPTAIRSRVTAWASHWSVTQTLFPNTDALSAKAAYALFVLGPNARDAIPDLEIAAASGKPPLNWNARAALVRLGHEPLSALLKDLSLPSNSPSWRDAVDTVAVLGPEARAATPHLIRASLTGPVAQVAGLPPVGTAPANRVPASLSTALGNTFSLANNALSRIAPDPAEAIPVYLPYLQHSNSMVRVYALVGLGRFSNHVALAQITPSLHDTNASVRSIALSQIKAITPPEQQAAAARAVHPLLNDPVLSVRVQAISLIGNFGTEADIPALNAISPPDSSAAAAENSTIRNTLRADATGPAGSPPATSKVDLQHDYFTSPRLQAIQSKAAQSQSNAVRLAIHKIQIRAERIAPP